MQGEALSYLVAELATKEDLRELRAEIETVRTELREAIATSGRKTMESILAFENRLFTLILALVGTLTAVFTLLALLIR